METLSNSLLTINVSAIGAELQNIIKNGREYLWQGDKRFWGRRSPVLFPIVGRVWNNIYRVDGKSYELGQHGFARDMEFELISKDDNFIEYVCESNDNTLKNYPFPFKLYISYILKDNKVIVRWKVENIGDNDMYFQIGAHPAFNFPDFNTTTDKRGFFAFYGKKDLVYNIPIEKGCVGDNYQPLQLKGGLMEVDIHTFDCDTYLFEDNQLRKVTFLDKKHFPYISVEFDAPLLALWSPTKEHLDCPFFCIEPWYGRCDSLNYEGEFKDRDYTQYLPPKRSFEVSYSIIIE